MSLSLLIGCLWVIAAAITGMMPMKYQYPPGLTLLIAAPFVLIFIGIQHGFWITAVGTLAFVSMFRHPLRYLTKKALGLPTAPPPTNPEVKEA